jgi:uncharacterized protein
MHRVGVISDTHGLLRPTAVEFLTGCRHIIHGGDVGSAEVLDALAKLAPVTAVRGNNDTAAWAAALPESARLRIDRANVLVIHDLARLDIDPAAAGLEVVVSGHSHRPTIERRHGVLFLNPGSAGPRRFKLPIAIAELTVTGNTVSARVVELAP